MFHNSGNTAGLWDAKKSVEESAKGAVRPVAEPATRSEARLFLEKTERLDLLFGPYSSTLPGTTVLSTFDAAQKELSKYAQMDILMEAERYGIDVRHNAAISEKLRNHGSSLSPEAAAVSEKMQIIAFTLRAVAESKINEKIGRGEKRFLTKPILELLILSYAVYRQAAVQAHENNSDVLAAKLLDDAIRAGLRAGMQWFSTA